MDYFQRKNFLFFLLVEQMFSFSLNKMYLKGQPFILTFFSMFASFVFHVHHETLVVKDLLKSICRSR